MIDGKKKKKKAFYDFYFFFFFLIDPNLRVQARRLQKHKWLKDVRIKQEEQEANKNSDPIVNATVDEAAKRINELKEIKHKAEVEAKEDIKRIKRMDSMRMTQDDPNFWKSPNKMGQAHRSPRAGGPSSKGGSVVSVTSSGPSGGGGGGGGSKVNTMDRLAAFREGSDDNVEEDFDDMDLDAAFGAGGESDQSEGGELQLRIGTGSGGLATHTSESPRTGGNASFGRFVDDNDEGDWDADFGESDDDGGRGGGLRLHGSGEGDSGDDPFADLGDESSEGELVLNAESLEQRLVNRQEREWTDRDEIDILEDDDEEDEDPAVVIEQQVFFFFFL